LSNHGEAQAAESVDDFIHKLSICLKELKETRRWLKLIARVPLLKPESQVAPVLQETEELIRIFAKSIQTAKKRKLSR
jgi:four helix bundle protein